MEAVSWVQIYRFFLERYVSGVVVPLSCLVSRTDIVMYIHVLVYLNQMSHDGLSTLLCLYTAMCTYVSPLQGKKKWQRSTQ